MSQFAGAFQGATEASHEAMVADMVDQFSQMVTRLEEAEAKTNTLQTQYNELFDALVGSTQDFYASSGGALDQMNETLGDGLSILARIIPTGTIMFTHQTDRLALREAGWLICDGHEASMADYPELYSVVGNKWGPPLQSGYFQLPQPEQLFAEIDPWFDALNLVEQGGACWIIRM